MAEQPTKKDWMSTQITINIPDWTAIPLFFLLLLALSWWVAQWRYHPVIAPPREITGLISYSGSSMLFFPLIIALAIGYALWIAAVVSSTAGKPRTFTHAHIRTLMWVHGLIRFHVPTPTQDSLAQQSLPSQVAAYLRLTLQGLSPAHAINRTLQSLPTRIQNTLLAAQSIHCLEPALGQSITRLQEAILLSFTRRPRLVATGPLLFLAGLIPFMTFILFPRFSRMLIDFETTLPPLSRQFFLFCQWFTVGGHALGIPSWPLLNLPGFIWTLILLPILALGTNPLALAFLPLTRHPLALKTPGIGPLIADRDWDTVYSVLSLAIARGIPLPQAIQAANLPDLNNAIKSPLLRWQANLAAGQHPADAASAAGMPHRLTAALNLAATNTSLANSLEQLARFHQSRAHWRADRLAGIVPIAFTLLSGLVVGLIVLGLADAGAAVFMHVQNNWH
jgi:type II secretory pathway component PulF